jgi:hypothetical protein
MKKIIVTTIILITTWAAIPWSYLASRLSMQDSETISSVSISTDESSSIISLILALNAWSHTQREKYKFIEDMKTILDGRVRRIGTTEPSLNTALLWWWDSYYSTDPYSEQPR